MEDDEQEEQEEQEGVGSKIGNKIVDSGKKKLEAAKDLLEERAKEKAKEVAVETAKKIGEALAKLIADVLAAIAPYIIPIIAVILIIILVAACFYALSDEIFEVAEKINSSLLSYIQLESNGPVIPSANKVTEMINQTLEENGIDKSSLNMGTESQRDAYLYKFMAASLATQLPYIKDSKAETLFNIAINAVVVSTLPAGTSGLFNLNEPKEVQGIVKIKRKTGGTTKELTYKKHGFFSEMISNNNKDAINYFSIDENWMLCVAKNNATITINPDGNTGEENSLEEVKIPYQTLISTYSIPFEFFIALQQVSRKS